MNTPLNIIKQAPVRLVKPSGKQTTFRADTDAARGDAIRAACTAAASGDQIILGPGRFILATTLNTSAKSLAVSGAGMQENFGNATGTSIEFTTGGWTVGQASTLSSLKLRGAANTPLNIGGSYVVLQNCMMDTAFSSANGMDVPTGGAVVAFSCWFRSDEGHCVSVTGGDGELFGCYLQAPATTDEVAAGHCSSGILKVWGSNVRITDIARDFIQSGAGAIHVAATQFNLPNCVGTISTYPAPVGQLQMREQLVTPDAGAAGLDANIFIKGDKLVIQFNDAGTTRYKYLDLTGTGVTWVHTTTAP